MNLDATLAAQEKAAAIGERFAEWAWEDPVCAGKLARASGANTPSVPTPAST